MKEILLDCRELESPKPLELLNKELQNLDESSYIKMLHRFEPVMLFGILEKNGFSYEVKKGNDIEIIIKKRL